MDNFPSVQGVKSHHHLVKNGPNFRFTHVFLIVFGVVNLGLQVTPICKLHHNAQSPCARLHEGFLVASDVLRLNRSQNSNLIDCVVFLLFGEFCKFYLSQSVSMEEVTFLRA